jgi:carboxypeptidase Taq
MGLVLLHAPMSQEARQPDETYEEFLDHVRKYSYVGDASGVLSWDQQVMMPEGGTPARSKQSSTLSTLQHELLTDDDLADWLEELDGAVEGERQAVVREVKRSHERASAVPEDLVKRISEASSNALPVWEEAKAESDFSTFEETLEELVELRREYAEAIDPDRDPYEVLFEDYEPYIDIETAEEILTELREELPDLIDAIAESDVEPADPFEGEYDEGSQEALVRDALDTIGYDWDRGRLDTAPHPFSTGTQFDARVTTRFAPEDPMGAVGSTIHEYGHASYTLGLLDEQYGTPLGESRDMTVHESQSRLWENHVGRSKPFWRLFAPRVEEHLGVDASPQAFYEHANEVYDDNLIRVEADELTYHMHIVLRFEIERDLIRGDLDVSEVPQVWNDKMEEYLGVRPDNDAEGCLQDIHWSHGNFGYFPTYSLGSVLASQLFAAAEDELGDLDDDIESGDFDRLYGWLNENVHEHGCRYTTPDLIQEATGEAFTAEYFLDYADEKYSDLYDL